MRARTEREVINITRQEVAHMLGPRCGLAKGKSISKMLRDGSDKHRHEGQIWTPPQMTSSEFPIIKVLTTQKLPRTRRPHKNAFRQKGASLQGYRKLLLTTNIHAKESSGMEARERSTNKSQLYKLLQLCFKVLLQEKRLNEVWVQCNKPSLFIKRWVINVCMVTV